MSPANTPREIGPYAIVETVAARAFTVTYRGEQRALGRTVLIKTLKSTVSAGSLFAAELEREAALLGRLDHEGVIRLYDFVQTPERLYLVLEDARAISLEKILAALGGQRVDPEVAAAVALAVARAVAHAHDRGVVHRGIQSAVVAISARGRVLLTDFSSADAPAAELPSLPEPIEAGETFARPDFMAPEQILGEPADARSDVWSLGVLFHELLAGSRPFAAEDPRDVSPRIRSGPAAPLPPGVPPPLARIVARCLAKEPQDRYPDGRALAAAIEEALAPITRLPIPVLATRALAAARLGDALSAPAGLAPREPRAPSAAIDVARAARGFAIVFGLLVLGTVVLRTLDDPDAAPAEGVPEAAPATPASRDRGLLRVVAAPWAEVYLDGELVDTTPIGRPIPVTPGRHFVTFRHPAAPDEQRTIKIAAGQIVFLDVTMRIDRGDAGARDAGPKPPASP